MILFSEYQLGNIELQNRMVMAPLTRCRAINNLPNELMATYYSQRAGAGLLITEGTAPSANGLGYARIPGIYSDAQIEGWKLTTDAVHAKGGKIFMQLMHCGRVCAAANMEADAEVVAPSALQAPGEMYTDSDGMQPHTTPRAMTLEDIAQARAEYVNAAKNAIRAGFDGVEIHAANGYLIEQFINTASNKREDEYGGSIENRIRFALDVTSDVVEAIGAGKVGIRVSPYGVFNGMEVYDELDATYAALSEELGNLDLAYVHIVNHSSMGTPPVPESVYQVIREGFDGPVILSGGYNKERGEADLEAGKGELVAYGRPYLANPDLAHRYKNDLGLNAPDADTFYTPGAEGYTDYPTAGEE